MTMTAIKHLLDQMSTSAFTELDRLATRGKLTVNLKDPSDILRCLESNPDRFAQLEDGQWKLVKEVVERFMRGKDGR
jgi:hypothetical protein